METMTDRCDLLDKFKLAEYFARDIQQSLVGPFRANRKTILPCPPLRYVKWPQNNIPRKLLYEINDVEHILTFDEVISDTVYVPREEFSVQPSTLIANYLEPVSQQIAARIQNQCGKNLIFACAGPHDGNYIYGEVVVNVETDEGPDGMRINVAMLLSSFDS